MRPTRDLILAAARMTGYPVKIAWSSRDKGAMGDVLGVVEHHTGTPVNYQHLDDYPTLAVVRDGRAGLINSLSAYGLGRSGTIYCISARLSWHAGEAWWGGVTDVNGHYLGIEAESDGTYWTSAQRDCYPRLSAAILHTFGRGVGSHPRHAEVARPPGRKSDWSGLDRAAHNASVARYLAAPASIRRGMTPAPAPIQEDDMAAVPQSQWDEVYRWVRASGPVLATLIGKEDGTGERLADVQKDLGDDEARLTAAITAAQAVILDALARPVRPPAVRYVQQVGRAEVYEVVSGRARHVSAEEWGVLIGGTPDMIRRLDPAEPAELALLGQLGIATVIPTGAMGPA